MRASIRKGFTLVEILIVVVILGILAAIVVPQFTSASQEAIKGALGSQLQTINSQVELYRVQNAGNLPHTHEAIRPAGDTGENIGGAQHAGWGVFIENNYLKAEPRNGFTRDSSVVAAATPTAWAQGIAQGWTYSNAGNNTAGTVNAVGYDKVNNLLANEDDYVAATADVW